MTGATARRLHEHLAPIARKIGGSLGRTQAARGRHPMERDRGRRADETPGHDSSSRVSAGRSCGLQHLARWGSRVRVPSSAPVVRSRKRASDEQQCDGSRTGGLSCGPDPPTKNQRNVCWLNLHGASTSLLRGTTQGPKAVCRDCLSGVSCEVGTHEVIAGQIPCASVPRTCHTHRYTRRRSRPAVLRERSLSLPLAPRQERTEQFKIPNSCRV
jgi:hypothetical protein